MPGSSPPAAMPMGISFAAAPWLASHYIVVGRSISLTADEPSSRTPSGDTLPWCRASLRSRGYDAPRLRSIDDFASPSRAMRSPHRTITARSRRCLRFVRRRAPRAREGAVKRKSHRRKKTIDHRVRHAFAIRRDIPRCGIAARVRVRSTMKREIASSKSDDCSARSAATAARVHELRAALHGVVRDARALRIAELATQGARVYEADLSLQLRRKRRRITQTDRDPRGHR